MEKYVDLLDLGLILVWAGVLLLVMQVVMHRPRRPRRPRGSAYDDRTDQWYANDVHRPGYAGETAAPAHRPPRPLMASGARRQSPGPTPADPHTCMITGEGGGQPAR